jgi:DNA-binding protein Fis
MDQHKPSDQDKLVKSFEARFEVFAEKLLISQVSDRDSVLLGVQAMIERVFIKSAMKLAKNNVSKAAKLLGMNRNTLNRKLKGSD